jgi:hydroxyacylglutathione hydrolase
MMGMRSIRTDLWETATDRPAPGLTTRAYLWVPPVGGNVLFYNTAGLAELDAIVELGGITDQYLSHRDEVGPTLVTIGERFGNRLHGHVAEVADAARFRAPDVTFHERHVDDRGIEVIPTPGHSPGSTCFLVEGDGDLRYLFTGDTMLLGADGRWFAGNLPGVSDPEALAASLELLAELEPDLVVSSAFAGDHGAHLLGDRSWRACVDEALAGLDRVPSSSRNG